MQTKQRTIKKYEELTFTDDYMFYRVLLNRPELCKEMLELILDKKISKITYPEAQKTISMTAEGRGIRLDIYVEDEDDTIYNIEMQTTYDSDIPKRSRYYQGLIDLETMNRGDSFRKLKKTFIIFICMFDPFRQSRCIYHFQNICLDSDKPIYYGDESYKIVVNPFGRNEGLSDDMKAFMSFLRGDVIDKRNRLVFELDGEVDKVRTHKEWRAEYMLLEQKLKDEFDRGRMESMCNYIQRLYRFHVPLADIVKSVAEDFAISNHEAELEVSQILNKEQITTGK